MTIAQFTDVHLGPIEGFSPRYWSPKRVSGYANWQRERRDAYSQEVLDRLVADMYGQDPIQDRGSRATLPTSACCRSLRRAWPGCARSARRMPSASSRATTTSTAGSAATTASAAGKPT